MRARTHVINLIIVHDRTLTFDLCQANFSLEQVVLDFKGLFITTNIPPTSVDIITRTARSTSIVRRTSETQEDEAMNVDSCAVGKKLECLYAESLAIADCVVELNSLVSSASVL